jgi:arylsulfatase A-like enzyme
MRRAASVGLVLAVAVALIVVSAAPTAADPGREGSKRPNIVLILTDDLDVGSVGLFPGLTELAERGTTFTNAFVSISLCCPSRASILRGQYAHNTHVFANRPPSGGFERFRTEGLESSTVATWLHDSGYHTALVGKYLNGYPGTQGATYVPPGWDEWYSLSSDPEFTAPQFDYQLNENGRLVTYGSAPSDYLTDVLAARSADVIRRASDRPSGRAPFFLYLAPYSPHEAAAPAPRHASAFPSAIAPRPPSFNEADVSDKPAWVRSRPLLTSDQISAIDDLYRARLRATLSIQDLVATVIGTLRSTGQLQDTYVFFASDNGFHLGQHRLERGKNTTYDEDIRVPLIVLGRHVRRGGVVTDIVANIDFAPTFAEIAGAVVPAFVDGRSLVPLLDRREEREERAVPWRQALLLEHGISGPVAERSPDLQGLRTHQHTYVAYVNGERELYDLAQDPYQLASMHETAPPELLTLLGRWLDALRACTGAGCRTAEDRPP